MIKREERRHGPDNSERERILALRRMIITLVVFWSAVGAATSIFYGMLRNTGVAP